MDNVKEKVVCESPPELLESVDRWRDVLEGSSKEMAFELFNQVLDGKITNEAAFTLLDSKQR
jgi:hypothetical protein